jgi:hypothetical protein
MGCSSFRSRSTFKTIFSCWLWLLWTFYDTGEVKTTNNNFEDLVLHLCLLFI